MVISRNKVSCPSAHWAIGWRCCIVKLARRMFKHHAIRSEQAVSEEVKRSGDRAIRPGMVCDYIRRHVGSALPCLGFSIASRLER